MRFDLRIVCVVATGAIACFSFSHSASANHHSSRKQATLSTQAVALMLAKRDGPGRYTIDYNAGNIAFNINDIISWSGGSPSDIGNLAIRTQETMSQHGLHDKCEDVLMTVNNAMMGHHLGNKAYQVFQECAKLRIQGVSPTFCVDALSKYVKRMGSSR